MKATDIDVIADVVGQALTAHRQMLESLIETRTRESVTAGRAVEITRDAVTEAEDRLREFLKASTSDAVLTMQRAAADEVTRLQGLLLDRMKTADSLSNTLHQLQIDLRETGAQLKDGASAFDLAVQDGFKGTLQDWFKTFEGRPGGEGAPGGPGKEGPPGLSAYAVARSEGFEGSLADWLKSLHSTTPGGPGEPGKDGKPGDPGPAGPSAYELACTLHGFKGSLPEWLESLRGVSLPAEPGARGEPGDRGLTGDRGPQGHDGAGITCDAWAPGIHREGKTVAAYIGQYFRALRDTSDAPYGSADWERVGSAGFHLAEPYAEGRAYRSGDLFVRDFGLFLWTEEGAQLLVGRGPRGEEGKRGEAGRNGTNGRDGFSFEVMELRGSALAIVVRDSDQRLHETSVDFFPVFEKIAEAIEQRLIERLTPEGA